MSQLSLVASAMSSILDIPVKTYDECVADGYAISPEQILDLNFVYRNSLMYINILVNEAKETFVKDTFLTFTTSDIQIFVKNISGDSQAMFVDPHITVLELKYIIQEKLEYDIRLIRLELANRRLEDHKTLRSYNIQHGDNIYISLRLLGGLNFYIIKEDFLDPRYDFDFTDLKDEKEYYRGNILYRRPYGWKRIALNVSKKYGHDDKWLGHVCGPNEWPVSYHGTKKDRLDPIAEEGYRLDKGERFKHGIGIYSTPIIETAEDYAGEFEHGGTLYKAVFQNRVNPSGFEKHSCEEYEYWVTPNEKDIRPYGLCVKKLRKVSYYEQIFYSLTNYIY